MIWGEKTVEVSEDEVGVSLSSRVEILRLKKLFSTAVNRNATNSAPFTRTPLVLTKGQESPLLGKITCRNQVSNHAKFKNEAQPAIE